MQAVTKDPFPDNLHKKVVLSNPIADLGNDLKLIWEQYKNVRQFPFLAMEYSFLFSVLFDFVWAAIFFYSHRPPSFVGSVVAFDTNILGYV